MTGRGGGGSVRGSSRNRGVEHSDSDRKRGRPVSEKKKLSGLKSELTVVPVGKRRPDVLKNQPRRTSLISSPLEQLGSSEFVRKKPGRRPKFTDNPSAPEIVEKLLNNSMTNNESLIVVEKDKIPTKNILKGITARCSANDSVNLVRGANNVKPTVSDNLRNEGNCDTILLGDLSSSVNGFSTLMKQHVNAGESPSPDGTFPSADSEMSSVELMIRNSNVVFVEDDSNTLASSSSLSTPNQHTINIIQDINNSIEMYGENTTETLGNWSNSNILLKDEVADNLNEKFDHSTPEQASSPEKFEQICGPSSECLEPVNSVEIEQFVVLNEDETKSETVVPLLDMSKLFSKMENNFAKDINFEAASKYTTATDRLTSVEESGDIIINHDKTPSTPVDVVKSLRQIRVRSKNNLDVSREVSSQKQWLSTTKNRCSSLPSPMKLSLLDLSNLSLLDCDVFFAIGAVENQEQAVKTLIRVPSRALLNDTASKRRRMETQSEQTSSKEEEGREGYETSSDHLSGKATPDSQKSDGTKTPELMVVPEKAASFKIHPGRCCSDTCFYCGLRFGMLDTPLHISQLKSDDSQEFAVNFSGFSRDACLCDKCFRYLDRRARSNKFKNAKSTLDAYSTTAHYHPPSPPFTSQCNEEGSLVKRSKLCMVRNCVRELSGNSIGKKWLIRLKKKLMKKFVMDWERVKRASVKALFPFCLKHYSLIESFCCCGLCKKKLSIGGVCILGGVTKEQVLELNEQLKNTDHIPSDLLENSFVCKDCKTFCTIKLKCCLQTDYLRNHKDHKDFFRLHKKRLHDDLGLHMDIPHPNSVAVSSTPKKIRQVNQSDNPTKFTIKTTTVVSDEKNLGENHDLLRSITSQDRPTRKRKSTKELTSPNHQSYIQVNSSQVGKSTSTATESSESEYGAIYSINIQFDANTKRLWDELHYPYSDYTGFLRHLILLEKYWRSDDLILNDSASIKASSYLQSIKNRIEAYEVKHKRSCSDLSECTVPTSRVVPSGLKTATKIRVRTDLTHIGLLSKDTSEKEDAPPSVDIRPTSSAFPPFIRMTHPSSLTNTESSNTTRSSNLSEPPVAHANRKQQEIPPPALPHSGVKLFRGSSTTTTTMSEAASKTATGSAIPLTFNNSIAEVWVAANKQQQQQQQEQQHQQQTCKSNEVVNVMLSSAKPEISITPCKKSTINRSILPRTQPLKLSLPPAPLPTHIQKEPHLVDMNTHLQNQASVMSVSCQSLLTSKVHSSKNVSGVPSTMNTINKKSLDNVLDRLSGLKAPLSTPPTNAPALIKQLQAPPIVSAAPSGLQYNSPWIPTCLNEAQAAASIMAGGGLPSLTQIHAAAAMQELLKMSALSQQTQAVAALQQQRLQTPSLLFRGPPPLTHMGAGTAVTRNITTAPNNNIARLAVNNLTKKSSPR